MRELEEDMASRSQPSSEGTDSLPTRHAEPSAEYFSVVYRGNLRKLKRNPFLTETPFGFPVTVGFGHAFAEFDEFDARHDALRQALEKAVALGDAVTASYTAIGGEDRLKLSDGMVVTGEVAQALHALGRAVTAMAEHARAALAKDGTADAELGPGRP